MKNLQFLENFKGNFAISSNFFKFSWIFCENLEKNLELCIRRGSGAQPPDASEFLEILVEKSM